MKLSILIVNWNSKDYLRECLRSIRMTSPQPAPQVVVVDGGSFDGCADMLAAEYPEVDFIQCTDNIGFGRANNLGLANVAGDALLLLNPDTVLHSGALANLLDALASLNDAGVVGARLLNSDGSLQLSAIHSLPTPWNVVIESSASRRKWWDRHGPRPNDVPREVEAVSGACMLVRTEVFRQLGGFDPCYFMYAEDVDLCHRVRMLGLRNYHVPQALVTHHGGGSSRQRFSKFSSIMIREAVLVYIRTHHGAYGALIHRASMAVSAILRLTLLAPRALAGGLENRVLVHKWWTVLRWCLGLEPWAAAHFQSQAQDSDLLDKPAASITGYAEEPHPQVPGTETRANAPPAIKNPCNDS